jgi:rubrerythrin
MDYSAYSGGGYTDKWSRWVMDNMQGNIPDYSMPAPPAVREDPYNAHMNLDAALITMKHAAESEADVRAFYDYMLAAAPSEEDREIIAGIRHDDLKHFSLLRQIYYDITGEKLAQAKEGQAALPATYADGLMEALMGEQQAVMTYRKVMFAMRSRRHVNMVTEIMTDELRHLGLYNYLYTKNSHGTQPVR